MGFLDIRKYISFPTKFNTADTIHSRRKQWRPDTTVDFRERAQFHDVITKRKVRDGRRSQTEETMHFYTDAH